MKNLATIISTWDIIEPLLKLSFALALAIAAVVLICRVRRTWWRVGIAVVFAGAGYGVVRQFHNERYLEGEIRLANNTSNQLRSLNLSLTMIQIDDADAMKQSDLALMERLLSDEKTDRFYARTDEKGILRDYWDNPLFIVSRSDGFRFLRSAGPDGRAGTDDDLR
jgi:hypothetical protein